MRTQALVLILCAAIACHSQTTSQPVKAGEKSVGPFNESAVWPPEQSFLTAVQAACGKMQAAAATECVADEMTKAGAPADAVKFTRELSQTTQQIGIMGAFKPFPPVGLAWVVYPLRSGDENGLLIVDGQPLFVDPDDMANMDRQALQKEALFQTWKKTSPKLDVYPGDRAGGAAQVKFFRVWPGKNPGELRFLFTYPLRDGCATCNRLGFANYLWDFDASGKLTGVQLLSVTRGAPPHRRDVSPQPAPPQPVTPPPAAQAPASNNGAPTHE